MAGGHVGAPLVTTNSQVAPANSWKEPAATCPHAVHACHREPQKSPLFPLIRTTRAAAATNSSIVDRSRSPLAFSCPTGALQSNQQGVHFNSRLRRL
ncbi:hypothetical protein PI124_g10724 [Phytophthora idaei]|nr:hypothetical protein PI124_g10724 [Phytophthora idaei]